MSNESDSPTVLPEGSSVVSSTGYGGSYWSETGKIDVRLKDGATESYFIKVCITYDRDTASRFSTSKPRLTAHEISRTPIGRKMAEGEYESLKLLRNFSPEMVPKPIGCGTFEENEDVHFLLCEFVDLYDELPDVVDFCQGIAELHRRSMKHSPNGKFGFEVTTCNETVPQRTKWTSSWEAFFTESLKEAFELEEEVHEPCFEILEMQPALFEKVCPRLLRPLETESRSIRPCLVHGDLWDGNIAVHSKTGQPIIFDASSLWAHNEYELHIWKGARYRMGKTFFREYFRNLPISPPRGRLGRQDSSVLLDG